MLMELVREPTNTYDRHAVKLLHSRLKAFWEKNLMMKQDLILEGK